MVIPLEVEARTGEMSQEGIVQAISSRQAGGKALKVGMPKVKFKFSVFSAKESTFLAYRATLP
jgi:4'-phosphopantetheinyl transferase EntD